MNDEYYMQIALELATRGAGYVSPNPMVGAVIVKNGKVIATGYHQLYGKEHAEVKALKVAGAEAKDSTMYVTLEPCVHHGKTPPCAPQIIAAGVKRVVVAMVDPNPLVAGKGISMLKEAGIEVKVGVLEERAKKLNEAFIKYITTDMPFVVLKVAQTMDGKIATCGGESKWITCEESRKVVHSLRTFYDAVLVGIGTVIMDNPMLNVRLVEGRNPLKIVLDSNLRIPEDANVVVNEPEKLLLVTSVAPGSSKEKRLRDRGVRVWHVQGADGKIDIRSLLKKMHDERIASVLVEGGKSVFSSFLRERVIDKVLFFVAAKILGMAMSPFDDLQIDDIEGAIRFRVSECSVVGEDIMVEGYF